TRGGRSRGPAGPLSAVETCSHRRLIRSGRSRMSRTALIYAAAVVTLSAAVGVAVWYLPTAGRTGRPEGGTLPPSDDPAAHKSAAAARPAELPRGVRIRFDDVTEQAGIRFPHVDARTDMQSLMDSTGPGVAWIDFDQDGLLDLFLVQGSPFVPPYPKGP